ncbi:hypothetical protein VC_A0968 [Vibrio cholerae O1 biovar El Tor str. N16961]|uniref:Uncharacterized protein n=1 Tax=Vibrio cholerae serotype O1 (strain ATCC 39315 / El Tor Inaba N16961) TaxID=243277 RepID=Q9KKY2_VIBCH|nr:hypothetical protein VC_A0968 [Vibrio cholerae O1 biovar El Tor str. N16961]ACP11823.1 conserved hypothetical protein [Vibrio cholerae O395]CSC72591.1 Uncharacterised protein [Vibrio cholerae]CSI58470.1 Uncharacterised protein [Vibrio cholerae]
MKLNFPCCSFISGLSTISLIIAQSAMEKSYD